MGRPSGAHTHPPSGGVIVAALVAGAVLFAVVRDRGAARAVAGAGQVVTHVLDLVLIGVLSVLGLAVAGCAVAGLVVLRRRRGQPRRVERGWTATVDPAGPHADRPMRDLPRGGYTTAEPPPSVPGLEPPPLALTRRPAEPAEVHYHVHVHGPGTDPQAIAEALRNAR